MNFFRQEIITFGANLFNIKTDICSKIYRDKISGYYKHPRAGHNTQHLDLLIIEGAYLDRNECTTFMDIIKDKINSHIPGYFFC